MNDDNALMRFLWPLLASLAGAVTALSLRPWQGMSRGEVILAVFVGASFAYFVAPWVVWVMFKDGPVPIRALGVIYYGMASGSNALIPLIIKKLGNHLGLREGEDK
jgi:hypothetical protein